MSILDAVRAYHDELTTLRRDFHAHPELGLEEFRTAEIVAKKLESWGIEVHRGIGRTGVVGVLRKGTGTATVGLRADMDCLAMDEETNLPHRSQIPGRMHACGHDGHTTMLLGAAKYLAEQGNFDGTVNFIFQPGEEGAGGALAMLEDRLFERFPCDRIYGMHNWPSLPVGQFAIAPGPALAGGAFFDITINGKGAHGARPEGSIDPVLVACQLTSALQSIIARNVSPAEQAVLSITKITAGDAYNVIPQSAVLSGTARAFKREVLNLIGDNMKRMAQGVAAGFGATAEVDFRIIFAPLINDPPRVQEITDAAAAVVGDDRVERNWEPMVGSEDFAFMMEQRSGAYIFVGNGDTAAPHHPAYDFNDECTPYGAAMFAGLVERELA